MTDEKLMVDLFKFDDVWEWKFVPSDNLFIHKITHADQENDQIMYMLHYLDGSGFNKKMLCLLASEDLDAVKQACMKFYMSQSLDAE